MSSDRVARQMRLLAELAEIGMGLARAVAAQATHAGGEGAEPSPFGGADLGLVYSRVARAVRQTLALEARLERDHYDFIRAQAADHRAETGALAARRRKAVRRVVVQALSAEAQGDDLEDLLDDLDERLDDEDDTVFGGRPFGEIVAGICRDLGVTPEETLGPDLWPRLLNEADWGLEAAADAATSPGEPPDWPARDPRIRPKPN